MGIYIYKNNEKFGPYSLDQIRVGLEGGAFLRTDLACQDGMQDWQPLVRLLPIEDGGFVESYSASGAMPWAAASPRAVSSASSNSSRTAVASLVVGCVIFFLSLPMLFLAFATRQMALLFTPLPTAAAAILGHMAIGAIKGSGGKLTGRRMALAGMILGYAGLALDVIVAAMFFILPHKLTRSREEEIASRTLVELKMLNNAIDAYALYSQKPPGDPVTPDQLRGFLDPGTDLSKTFRDPLGHEFGPFSVGSPPKVPQKTYQALNDVTDSAYWSPYH